MEIARFVVFIIKIAIVLAMLGQLKSCTAELMGLAAAKTETGMMSYAAWNRRLWGK